MLPVSGAAEPNICGADPYRPRISFRRPSFSCPKPGPPSSSSRKIAQRPCALISSCRGLTSARTRGSGDRTAYGNTMSSGSISSRQNSSTQSSFFWNSGSVEKSHAMSSPWKSHDCQPGVSTEHTGVARLHPMAVPIEIPDLVRLKALALGSEGERWMASLADSLAVFEERVGDRDRPAVPRRQRGLRGERHHRRRRARRAQAGDARRARRKRQVRTGAPGGTPGTRTGIRGPPPVRRRPSSDAAGAPGSTHSRRRAADRGADRRHRSDRQAGLATTGGPVALANRRRAGRVAGGVDRSDLGSARSAVSRARGAARSGVRAPATRSPSTRTLRSRSTATPIRGTCSSPHRAGSSSSTPTACGQSRRTISRSLSATGTTSCSPASRARRCDPGARAFKKVRASTRKPSGSGPMPNGCPPGCSSCAWALPTACRSWRSRTASRT